MKGWAYGHNKTTEHDDSTSKLSGWPLPYVEGYGHDW